MLRQVLAEWRMNPEIVPDAPTAMAKLAKAAAAGHRFRLVLADFKSVGKDGTCLGETSSKTASAGEAS